MLMTNNTFSDKQISLAKAEDAFAITQLLNKAYRGEEARKGWTTEADIIEGDQRTNNEEVSALIHKDKSDFLLYKKDEEIIGCINTQVKEGALYIGMLSVEPAFQNAGIGKKLIKASEEFALAHNCTYSYMTVIDIRNELIKFYNRLGYYDTGERIPFVEDAVSGKHLQPLRFMVMKKDLV